LVEATGALSGTGPQGARAATTWIEASTARTRRWGGELATIQRYLDAINTVGVDNLNNGLSIASRELGELIRRARQLDLGGEAEAQLAGLIRGLERMERTLGGATTAGNARFERLQAEIFQTDRALRQATEDAQRLERTLERRTNTRGREYFVGAQGEGQISAEEARRRQGDIQAAQGRVTELSARREALAVTKEHLAADQQLTEQGEKRARTTEYGSKREQDATRASQRDQSTILRGEQARQTVTQKGESALTQIRTRGEEQRSNITARGEQTRENITTRGADTRRTNEQRHGQRLEQDAQHTENAITRTAQTEGERRQTIRERMFGRMAVMERQDQLIRNRRADDDARREERRQQRDAERAEPGGAGGTLLQRLRRGQFQAGPGAFAGFGRDVLAIAGGASIYDLLNNLQQVMALGAKTVYDYVTALNDFQIALQGTGQDAGGLVTDLGRLAAAAGQAPAEGLDAAARGVRLYSEQIQRGVVSARDAAKISADIALQGQVLTGEDFDSVQRDLVAVTQAFNLSLGDQARVLDAATVAHQEFAVSQKDVLDGMAELAGEAQGSGYSLEELAATVGHLAQITGQSGTQVAEEFKRIIAGLGSTQARTALRQFGVDTTQTVEAQIQQLRRVYPQLAQSQQRELINIVGQRRSGVIAQALLTGGDDIGGATTQMFRQVGRGAEEFNRRMNSWSGTIRKIGADLQLLATNVANSGLLDLFGSLIRITEPLLSALNRMLEAWNQLPRPLRSVAVQLAEIYGLLRLLRAFTGWDIAKVLGGRLVAPLFGAQAGMAAAGWLSRPSNLGGRLGAIPAEITGAGRLGTFLAGAGAGTVRGAAGQRLLRLAGTDLRESMLTPQGMAAGARRLFGEAASFAALERLMGRGATAGVAAQALGALDARTLERAVDVATERGVGRAFQRYLGRALAAESVGGVANALTGSLFTRLLGTSRGGNAGMWASDALMAMSFLPTRGLGARLGTATRRAQGVRAVGAWDEALAGVNASIAAGDTAAAMARLRGMGGALQAGTETTAMTRLARVGGWTGLTGGGGLRGLLAGTGLRTAGSAILSGLGVGGAGTLASTGVGAIAVAGVAATVAAFVALRHATKELEDAERNAALAYGTSVPTNLAEAERQAEALRRAAQQTAQASSGIIGGIAEGGRGLAEALHKAGDWFTHAFGWFQETWTEGIRALSTIIGRHLPGPIRDQMNSQQGRYLAAIPFGPAGALWAWGRNRADQRQQELEGAARAAEDHAKALREEQQAQQRLGQRSYFGGGGQLTFQEIQDGMNALGQTAASQADKWYLLRKAIEDASSAAEQGAMAFPRGGFRQFADDQVKLLNEQVIPDALSASGTKMTADELKKNPAFQRRQAATQVWFADYLRTRQDPNAPVSKADYQKLADRTAEDVAKTVGGDTKNLRRLILAGAGTKFREVIQQQGLDPQARAYAVQQGIAALGDVQQRETLRAGGDQMVGARARLGEARYLADLARQRRSEAERTGKSADEIRDAEIDILAADDAVLESAQAVRDAEQRRADAELEYQQSRLTTDDTLGRIRLQQAALWEKWSKTTDPDERKRIEAQLNQLGQQFMTEAAATQQAQRLSTVDPRDRLGTAQEELRGMQNRLSLMSNTTKEYYELQRQIWAKEQEIAQMQAEGISARERAAIDPRDTVRNAEQDLTDARRARDRTLHYDRQGNVTPEYAAADRQVREDEIAVSRARVERANRIEAATVPLGDTVGQAAAALNAAKRNLTLAKGDPADWAEAVHAVQQAQLDYSNAVVDATHQRMLRTIDITDPVAMAREDLRTARSRLRAAQRAGVGGEALDQLRNDVRSREAAQEQAAFQQRFQDAQTNEQLGRISHAAYLRYLHNEHDRLTAIRHRTRQQQDELNQIDQALQAASEQMQGQWNIGDIRVPTIYEVRRSMAAQARGQNYADNSVRNVEIHINGDSIARIKAAVLEAVGQQVKTGRAANAGTSRKGGR